MIRGPGLTDQVLQRVETWIPARKYDAETEFRNDLQGYLETHLNQWWEVDWEQTQPPVTCGEGRGNADVAVSDEIAIEVVTDVTQSDKHRLSEKIATDTEAFPAVIVVACGISERGTWREVQTEHATAGGFGVENSDVYFVEKRREQFGTDPTDGEEVGDRSGGTFF